MTYDSIAFMHSAWSRYAFALAATAAAILLRLAFDPLLADRGHFTTAIAAVLLAAFVGGLGPGLLALVLAGLLAEFLFVEPRYTFGINGADHVALFALYFVLGFGVSVLGELYRRNQRRLRESKDRYYTLFNTVQDGFCIVRMIYNEAGKPVDFLIVEGNPAFAEHTGLKDSIGKSVREVEPSIEPFWIETYGRIAQTGVPERFENCVQAWDRWFDVYAYRFGEPANREVAVFFRDISARKADEQALAEAKQRVDAGLMAGEVATYTWDVSGDQLRGDRNFVRLFGVLKDEHHTAPLSEFIKVIHPDDLPRVGEALSATLERDEPYEIEYRIRANGSSAERWVLVRGEIVERDAQGAPLSWSGVLMDITERKKAEEQVRASQETFQQLVENSPFGVFIVDADFRMAVVSVGARPTFVNVRPLIGRDFAEVLRVVWPEPAASEFIARYRQTLETGEPYHSPSTVERRADTEDTGAYDWMIERIRMPDGRYGVVCHFYDLSERQRLESALRESEKHFRAVFEQTAAGIAETDTSGRFVRVNDTYCEIVGRSAEDLLTMRMQDITHPEDLPANAEQFIALVRGEIDHFLVEKRYVRPDGSSVWVRNYVSGIRDDAGQVQSVIAVVDDITDRKDIEERKDQFLAVLSHELRNPLAAIRMAAKMLKDMRDMPSSAEDMVGIVNRQTTQLVRLVDDLLDMSRISRGTFELHRQVIDLESVLRRAIEAADASRECHDVQVTVQKPDEPVLVDADPLRLSQVFSNLIGNACKYSKAGSTVEVAVQREGAAAIVRVRDEGVGIPPDRTDDIFEMFAQVDPDRDRRTGGLGIGLALSRGIVHMHGGTIEAHSEGEDKGSEFIVRLGLAQPREASAITVHENGRSNSLRTPRRRILAVDDNLDALEGLAGVLRSAGHDVLIAEDGPTALSLAANHKPEAALLDIGMPGMDGYQLAQQIRSASWGRDMTLIALTGWGQDKDKTRATEAGFNTHLTKPTDIESIEQALNSAYVRP